MKKCTKCQTENPQHANFCRRCGKPFVNMATEESQAIDNSHYGQTNHVLGSLRPVNEADFKYFDEDAHWKNMSAAVASLIGVPIFAGPIIAVIGGGIPLLALLEIPIVVYIIYKIIRWVISKKKFKKNVDFIEDGGSIVRIAKINRMGLYERPYCVLLESLYSVITPFDENHFLLEQNGKKGLYSKTYKKIIVPVQYDYISPFNNYTTIASSNGVRDQYDVKGNKWS